MRAEIYWITDLLAIMPRPRGNDWLEEEIVSFKNSGVDIIVSLLEYIEINELEIEKEEFYCRANEILFLSFPIGDRQTPGSFEEVFAFVTKLNEFTGQGKKVAIHCR